MDQGGRYLEGNPLDRALLAALIALGIIVLLRRQQQLMLVLRANLPVLLFFAYCGLSSVWSDYPDVAFKRWFRGVGDVVMVLVILTELDWVLALKRVLTRVAFLLLPLSVLLIRYYPNLGRGYSISGEAMFWTGVTSDKNGLGMICLIFGLGNLWYFMDIYQGEEVGRLRTRQLIAHGTVVLLTLWLLWESNSMTSITCFTLGAGLMLVTGRWRWARKPGVAAFLVAAAIAASAFVVFSGGGGGVLQTIGRNPTLTGRTEVWNVVLPFAQNSMIGTGYESFWLGSRLEKIGELTSSGINEAHNGYLEIYLNLGWVGLTLLALIVAMGYRRVVVAVNQSPAIGKLMLAYFTIGPIYNFTEAGFKMQNPVWIFFLLAVMAVQNTPESLAAFRFNRADSFPRPEPRRNHGLHAKFSKELN